MKPLCPKGFRCVATFRYVLLLQGNLLDVAKRNFLMNKTQHIASLTSIAEWCRHQHLGMLTPTGKPKTPPTYAVVTCNDCDDSSIQKLPSYNIVDGKRVKARPKPCALWRAVPQKRKVISLPQTRICKGPVTVVKRIGQEEERAQA